MNKNLLRFSLCFLPLLVFAGCASNQGPAPAAMVPAPSIGRADQPKEIQPAPESKSYSSKKDVFQGAEYDKTVAGAPANSHQIQLRTGEIVEVYRGSSAPGGERELAFYLPIEARSVAQLVVESKGFSHTYFIRATAEGDTVGGVVERRWLDTAGYNPKDSPSEARIQAAVKASPYLISVHH